MHVDKLFPSKYVKASDLNGKPITVTIARLNVENMGLPDRPGKSEDEKKPVLYFDKATKGLVLNRTNGMIIASLYGPETDNWIGKRITLYATRVKAFGEMHDAIRVRDVVPPAPATKPVEEVEESLNDAEDHLDDVDADLWETPSPTQQARQPEPA